MPISPYDTTKMDGYLITPYARSAWVIPVRGALLWEDSTSALILDSLGNVPLSGPIATVSSLSNRQDRRITWTYASLTSFWPFGKLRHLDSSQFLSMLLRPNFAFISQESNVNRRTSLEDTSKPSPPGRFRMSLSMVDHIKVYHDVACAMYLRNAPDAWSYQYRAEGDPDGGGGGEMKVGGRQPEFKLVYFD